MVSWILHCIQRPLLSVDDTTTPPRFSSKSKTVVLLSEDVSDVRVSVVVDVVRVPPVVCLLPSLVPLLVSVCLLVVSLPRLDSVLVREVSRSLLVSVLFLVIVLVGHGVLITLPASSQIFSGLSV